MSTMATEMAAKLSDWEKEMNTKLQDIESLKLKNQELHTIEAELRYNRFTLPFM